MIGFELLINWGGEDWLCIVLFGSKNGAVQCHIGRIDNNLLWLGLGLRCLELVKNFLGCERDLHVSLLSDCLRWSNNSFVFHHGSNVDNLVLLVSNTLQQFFLRWLLLNCLRYQALLHISWFTLFPGAAASHRTTHSGRSEIQTTVGYHLTFCNGYLQLHPFMHIPLQWHIAFSWMGPWNTEIRTEPW